MAHASSKLLLAGVVGAATALVAVPAPAQAATTTPRPVLQRSLVQHLATVTPTTATRVLVQAGGDLTSAKRAVAATGLRLETTLDRVGIAVAVGTPLKVQALGLARGVTRVDWADEPITFATSTSHVATRAVPVQDGAYDVDGDGTGDAFDGKGFAVAVVDTGVDGTHPMLQGTNGSRVRKNVKTLCDDVLPLLTGDYTTYDSCVVDATTVNDTDTLSAGGHGTHVAGIAGGARVTDRSGRQLRGAAPGAEVVGVSIGAGANTYGGALGLYWVLEHHADPCGDGSCAPVVAVNNSWGPSPGSAFDPTSPDVVVARALVADGVTVVWAAGNGGGTGSTSTMSPNGLDPTPGVISVANYDDGGTGSRDNVIAPGSSRGLASDVSTYPDLAAPGTRITSSCRAYLLVCAVGQDFADQDYNTLTGTSQAAPHVAGYVAVLQQAAKETLHRLLTPAEVEILLLDTAHTFGTRAWVLDTRSSGSSTATSFDAGHGLVDVTAALARLTGRSLTYPGPAACASDARFTDPAGDATAVSSAGTPLPSEPSVDVTAAWLTSNAAHDATFHWTVSDLPDSAGGTQGTGEQFDFAFSYAGRDFGVRAKRDLFVGQSFQLLDAGGATIATLSGSFDATTDTVTVTLPAGVVATASPGAPALTSGSVLSKLALEASRYAFLTSTTDTADGRCSFTVS
jgi:serine protease AprX